MKTKKEGLQNYLKYSFNSILSIFHRSGYRGPTSEFGQNRIHNTGFNAVEQLTLSTIYEIFFVLVCFIFDLNCCLHPYLQGRSRCTSVSCVQPPVDEKLISGYTSRDIYYIIYILIYAIILKK